MAFGAFKGSLSGTAASITNPFAISTGGPVTVAVGDLVVAVLAQQTALTVTAVSDNLGNTYSAQNAGTDSGNATGRMFYARVTTAGSLSSVSFATSASANDVAAGAIVIEGPFASSPLDASPANVQDLTSPFSAPATGTLSQADEVVVAWASMNAGVSTWAATSPNVLRLNTSIANIGVAIGAQTVTATTSVTPAFTNGTNPASDVLGTASFKKTLPRTAKRLRLHLNDLSKVWQDSAKTTPATAAGQPIGYVEDAYGNGFDVRQTISGSRPTLRYDSGMSRYSAEFDGIDDYLVSVNTTSLNLDEFALFLAIQRTGSNAWKRAFAISGATNSDTTADALSTQIDTGSGTFYIFTADGGAPKTGSGTSFAVHEGYKVGSSTTALIDGTAGTATTLNSADDSRNTNFYIGATNVGSMGGFYEGRIYSIEFDGTSGLSSGDRSTIRSFHATGSSGATFNDSVSETASAADTATLASFVTNPSLSETASAADSASAAWTGTRGVSESATAGDTASAAWTGAQSVTETASAADTLSGGLLLSSSLSESASALETTSATRTTAPSLAETAAAADTLSSALIGVNTQAETGSASESASAALVATRTLSESASAADTASPVLLAVASLAESGSATDSAAGALVVMRALAETTTAADTAEATWTTTGSLLEAASAADTLSGALVAPAALAETASAADSTSGTLVPNGSEDISETATAADTLSATLVSGNSLTEAATATDSAAASLVAPASLAEAASASETVAATALLPATLGETAAADDATDGTVSAGEPQVYSETLAETASATDAVSATGGQAVESSPGGTSGAYAKPGRGAPGTYGPLNPKSLESRRRKRPDADDPDALDAVPGPPDPAPLDPPVVPGSPDAGDPVADDALAGARREVAVLKALAFEAAARYTSEIQAAEPAAEISRIAEFERLEALRLAEARRRADEEDVLVALLMAEMF